MHPPEVGEAADGPADTGENGVDSVVGWHFSPSLSLAAPRVETDPFSRLAREMSSKT